MKYIFFILFLILSFSAKADVFETLAHLKWQGNIFVSDNVFVKSLYKLNKEQVVLMRDTYLLARKQFFKYQNIKENACQN